MAPPLDSNKGNCPLEMVNAFILLGLLIAANAYFFIRSRRKSSKSQDDTQVYVSIMKLPLPLILLFPCILILPAQANEVSDIPSSESSGSPLVSDLSVDQFSEVVKAIVQQTLEECAVEGDMEGKAKLNLDVTGDVTAKIVCKTGKDIEGK